ncbi:hypothetical protein D3C72_1509340 [compost metagenome]
MPEILYVIDPDLLGPLLLRHIHHHQRCLAHGLIEAMGQGAAADETALVLHHEGVLAPVAALEQLDGDFVLEVDVAGLAARQLAEGGAPVMGVPLQIHRLGNLAQHMGLAGAGHAGQHCPVALGRGPVLGVDQEAAQLLVAPGHPRTGDAGLVQPLLHRLRAQAATETVEQGIGLLAQLGQPALEALGAHRAAHQLVAERDGGGLALLLETGAHLGALLVRHQRQADGSGEGALLEFDGGAQVDERHILQEDPGQVRGEWQFTHRASPRNAWA